ncbi:hypothetical protein [Thiolapillus sp.]
MSAERKISMAILAAGFLFIALYWFAPEKPGREEQVAASVEEKIILPENTPALYRDIPEVQAYVKDLRDMLGRGEAVLPLQRGELDEGAQKAQEILLKDPQFLKDTKQDGKILHNDMMRILPAIVSALDANTKQACQPQACYQAEKYNFATNVTTRAIVNVQDARVLSVQRYHGMQPDISLRLARIARAIALNAPEVKRELGTKPSVVDISMANVRGALQESPCENSAHLCVAPVFADHSKERALWAIVDLTDLRLVAAKWTRLGKTTTPARISERSLQNRYIMENFCQKNTLFEGSGWKLHYRLTGSDGLEVIDASYRGQPVLASAKIVDWHVSYQQEGAGRPSAATETYMEGRRVEFVQAEDGSYFFGYNDAMGCPMFSTSVVLPFNAPQIRKLANGFVLTQDYRNPKWPMACNYRYENRFEFFDDGSFRIAGVNIGRGCGDNALYRPVMRIDLALGGKERFYKYEGEWRQWKRERLDEGKDAPSYQDGRYLYKIISGTDAARGYYIEPNRGQFQDASRGDHARVFAVRFQAGEGDQDLLTLGSCCDLARDGVERYLEDGASIDGENIVLWYVPRVHNDAREGHEYCWADTAIGENGNLYVREWPCVVGPKFVPVE